MRFLRNFQAKWTFFAGLAAATIVQATGTRLIGNLVRGELSAGGLLTVLVLAASYVLLVTGLVRLLAGSPAD